MELYKFRQSKLLNIFHSVKIITASDFDIDEELKRLQKIDPERYSDTEIRIQPVYIDPD